MTKNMIKAAIKMLEGNTDPKVECAKVILEEIVASLETKVSTLPYEVSATATSPINTNEVSVARPKVVNIPLPTKDEIYEIKVEAGKLISITGLKDTSIVELDGVKMPYKEAIGKAFQTGHVISV